jgi:hypothetical protein
MKYRKRPVVIDALQLTWANWQEMCEFAAVGNLDNGQPQGGWAEPGVPELWKEQKTDKMVLSMGIPTLEGLMIANENDWIIKGVQGELYPCKPDIFKQTYDPVYGLEQGFADPY